MWHRSVTAAPLDRNRPYIRRSYHRARLTENGARFDAGPDMQCEGGIGLGVGVEETIFDHQTGAAMPLLARLEHEFDGAGQFVAMPVQKMHRLDQHRRMRVV